MKVMSPISNNGNGGNASGKTLTTTMDISATTAGTTTTMATVSSSTGTGATKSLQMPPPPPSSPSSSSSSLSNSASVTTPLPLSVAPASSATSTSTSSSSPSGTASSALQNKNTKTNLMHFTTNGNASSVAILMTTATLSSTLNTNTRSPITAAAAATSVSSTTTLTAANAKTLPSSSSSSTTSSTSSSALTKAQQLKNLQLDKDNNKNANDLSKKINNNNNNNSSSNNNNNNNNNSNNKNKNNITTSTTALSTLTTMQTKTTTATSSSSSSTATAAATTVTPSSKDKLDFISNLKQQQQQQPVNEKKSNSKSSNFKQDTTTTTTASNTTTVSSSPATTPTTSSWASTQKNMKKPSTVYDFNSLSAAAASDSVSAKIAEAALALASLGEQKTLLKNSPTGITTTTTTKGTTMLSSSEASAGFMKSQNSSSGVSSKSTSNNSSNGCSQSASSSSSSSQMKNAKISKNEETKTNPRTSTAAVSASASAPCPYDFDEEAAEGKINGPTLLKDQKSSLKFKEENNNSQRQKNSQNNQKTLSVASPSSSSTSTTLSNKTTKAANSANAKTSSQSLKNKVALNVSSSSGGSNKTTGSSNSITQCDKIMSKSSSSSSNSKNSKGNNGDITFLNTGSILSNSNKNAALINGNTLSKSNNKNGSTSFSPSIIKNNGKVKNECDKNIDIHIDDSVETSSLSSSSSASSARTTSSLSPSTSTSNVSTATAAAPPPPTSLSSIKEEVENCLEEEAEEDSNSSSYDNNDNLILAKRRPVHLTSVNPHIICNLCYGYLIDATTIVECLHSFCHSCLIKHLRTENYCPRCEMMINTAKPNIKPDTTLQAIVYKLVPGLYERELMRKRAFYKDRPEEAALATPEQRGEDTEHLIFSPKDYMSLSLEYADLDKLNGNNADYSELLVPRYLKCPAMCTVGHLKKFVYMKFDIDMHRFNIDIMYKVKTIILLDHYTMMDVAYIYTWKRDAPMRFFFRVKESLRPRLMPKPKKEVLSEISDSKQNISQNRNEACDSKKPCETKDLKVTEINQIKNEFKEENEAESPKDERRFEIVSKSPKTSSKKDDQQQFVDPLRITIINKNNKDKPTAIISTSPLPSPKQNSKEKRDSLNHDNKFFSNGERKDERKVENIKLKIDLSKQNSVTIINMSDPERKQIVKSVKPEKEWKVKSKKQDKQDKESSLSSPKERKNKSPSPLTVPPLTIKAGRVSPLTKTPSSSPQQMLSPVLSEEQKKSDFLKSFALEPVKPDSPEKNKTSAFALNSSAANKAKTLASSKNLSAFSPLPSPGFAASSLKDEKNLMKPPIGVAPKAASASKRKSKEPIKTVVKKAKLSPVSSSSEALKLKISAAQKNASSFGSNKSPTKSFCSEKPSKDISPITKVLMPPPPPPPAINTISAMGPPLMGPPLKKPSKNYQKFVAPAGNLTPHPHAVHNGIQMAAPGNRTPIAKRYQPILPKAARPNPFANLSSDVNKILKEAGTEIIKSVSNDSKVYGPKQDNSTASSNNIMGPPSSSALPLTKGANSSKSSSNGNSANRNGLTNKSGANNAASKANYLNMALFNATKSKGNEVPPGCRTPMYAPNSPIYSPSSPQYNPSYNIPTMPTYKYTPKPANSNNYLQSVLGAASSQMASLFPSPPVRKDTGNNSAAPSSNGPSSNSSNVGTVSSSAKVDSSQQNQGQKRVYPFARSPSPNEDAPEKQLKVKSLLNSCNINIPSSLSITITREDSDSPTNSSSYPKHKSPVNNYIEILKLPEQQPLENNSLHSSNPTNNSNEQNLKSNMKTAPNSALSSSLKKDISDLKPIPSPQHIIARISQTSNQQQNQTSSKALSSMGSISPPANGLPSALPKINQQNANFPKPSPPLQQGNLDKKTPSPEKRNFTQTSPSSENKSPKSPNGEGQAAKKFRHILPRQNSLPVTEVVPPKVTSANVVGTYSSPSGVAVKIHANKKVPQSKKSPISGTNFQQQQQTSNKSSVLTPQSSPSSNAGKTNITPPSKSPSSSNSHKTLSNGMKTSTPPPSLANGSNSCLVSSPISSPNGLTKFLPLTGASPLSSPMHLPTGPPTPASAIQMMSPLPPNLQSHMSLSSPAPSNPNDLNKLLKDNILRAQVQSAAAAASNPNIFYTAAYAANVAAAAQIGQLAPSMYNYQVFMEQLSRMQRAGTDVFAEYMKNFNKDPNKMEEMSAKNSNLMGASLNISSPKTSPINAMGSLSAVGVGQTGAGAGAPAAVSGSFVNPNKNLSPSLNKNVVNVSTSKAK